MSKTVMYATAGINVRNSAAGSIINSIVPGSLMIYDYDDAPVRKALNGTTYTWIKVKYYYGTLVVGNSGTGWVATTYLSSVSTSIPAKSAVIVSNSYIRQDQILTNARYIFHYLLSLPSSTQWTAKAIAAMLGNMEQESNINPGKWEDAGTGFGLVQWTPPSKYTGWLSDSGYAGEELDIDHQIERILYEVEHGEQWLSSLHTPSLTFQAFTQNSSLTVPALAEYFLRCYEQPNNPSGKVLDRQNLAQKWYDLISAIGDF